MGSDCDCWAPLPPPVRARRGRKQLSSLLLDHARLADARHRTAMQILRWRGGPAPVQGGTQILRSAEADGVGAVRARSSDPGADRGDGRRPHASGRLWSGSRNKAPCSLRGLTSLCSCSSSSSCLLVCGCGANTTVDGEGRDSSTRPSRSTSAGS